MSYQTGPGNKTLIICISCMLLLHTWSCPEAAQPENNTETFFIFEEDRLAIQVEKVPLIDILNEIRREFLAEVSGLDHRNSEFVTLKASGENIEDILKQILRYLGEENYAFEYSANALKKLSVLPDGKTEAPPDVSTEPSTDSQEQFTIAARVHSIIEGSQAETAGLAVDDLIIKYDGIRIDSAMSLIREVRRKSDREQIEMLVVREGTILPFILKGGLIGVRINAAKIPLEELRNYGIEGLRD